MMRIHAPSALRLNLLLLLAAACGRPPPDAQPHRPTRSAAISAGTPATTVTVDTSVFSIGRETTSGNSVVRQWNQYDALGRPVAVQHVIGDSSYVYSANYGYPQGAVPGPG